MTYSAISEILQQHDADVGAAEAHGVATGMLCVEIKANVENWLRELFAETEQLIDGDRNLL